MKAGRFVYTTAIVFHARPRHVWFANGILGIPLVIVSAWIGFSLKVAADRDVRALRVGLIVFGAFALNRN